MEANTQLPTPNVQRPTKTRRIYLASSWRNELQTSALFALREAGHEVYDFRNPAPGEKGFSWRDIDPDWMGWEPGRFRDLLAHPIANSGFQFDWDAMLRADTGVLLLPCGRSAHLEAGYFAGAGKELFIVLNADKFEPELMYKMATQVCCSIEELLQSPSFNKTARRPLPIEWGGTV